MRRALAGIAVLGGLTGAVWWGLRGGHLLPGQARVAAASSAPAFTVVWTRPVAGLRAIAFSSDSADIAELTGANSIVSLWHRASMIKPIWQRPVAGATQIAVGAGGRSVLAYALLDPTQPTLQFLKGVDGASLTRSALDGAVWDAAVSADGSHAGIVTGNRTLYLFTLGDHPALHRWTLDGIGNSIGLASSSATLVAGTWDSSGIACYSRDGQRLWQYPDDPQERRAALSRRFTAQIAQDGETVLGLSCAGAHGNDAILFYWRSGGTGQPLWTHSLGGDTYFPQTQMTTDGELIAMTYRRVISRGEQRFSEQRLLVLNSRGETVLNKGGLLFSPNLVSLAPDGHRIIVSDGRRTLYALNADGRIIAKMPLTGFIRQTVISNNGRFLLVYTSDGILTLFQLG